MSFRITLGMFCVYCTILLCQLVRGDTNHGEDPLAIRLYTKSVAIQKLKYIHYNPLAEHWQLVKAPCDYKYSSAAYYETGETKFEFLKDLWFEF